MNRYTIELYLEQRNLSTIKVELAGEDKEFLFYLEGAINMAYDLWRRDH